MIFYCSFRIYMCPGPSMKARIQYQSGKQQDCKSGYEDKPGFHVYSNSMSFSPILVTWTGTLTGAFLTDSGTLFSGASSWFSWHPMQPLRSFGLNHIHADDPFTT